MSVLSDKWIRKMSKEEGMISPFEEKQIRGDNIHCQPTLSHVIDRAKVTRQHRWVYLSHSNSHQLIDLLRLSRHRCRKRKRFLPYHKRRGQQNILIPQIIRQSNNVTTVLVTTSKASVRNSKELIIIAAKCGKPGNFNLAFNCSYCDGRFRKTHNWVN